MKKVVEVLKFCARNILLLTPAGRAYYARRKALQRQAALAAVQQYGEEILAKVFELCDKRKIPSVVFFGTLLGCVRDGEIMKHDDDIDIAILPVKDLNVLQMISDFESSGFEFFWAWECDGNITEIAFTYKSVHVDFYFMYEKLNHFMTHWYTPIDGIKYATKKHWSTIECAFPKIKKIVDFKPLSFSSIVRVPDNFDEVLTCHYGAWQKPDSTWKSDAAGKEKANRKFLDKHGRMMDIVELKDYLK